MVSLRNGCIRYNFGSHFYFLPLFINCVETKPDDLESLRVEHHCVALVLLRHEVQEDLAVGAGEVLRHRHGGHVRGDVLDNAGSLVLPTLFI